MDSEPKLPGCVLYVEDDDISRTALGESLARMVTTVILADSARVGLDAFTQHQPDLVITDITMPGMSGLAMARALKNTHPHVPIVVTTAFSDTQYLLEAIEIGVDGYVLKPVEFDRVFALVRRNLIFVHRERLEKQHREEQRKLLEELQSTLAEVRTLKGILPICCSCKKIRNDKDYWEQVEVYVMKHTDAKFSHGYCPECLTKYFPGIELPEST